MYANFDPSVLQVTPGADYRDHESWKMPSYYFVDFFTGYSYKLSPKEEILLMVSVTNLFDVKYITDGSFPSGTPPPLYNATNASVYMNMGRRYNVSVRLNF